WYNSRPTKDLSELLDGVESDPHRIAVLAVDVTTGFCSRGPLSSPRVGRIAQPIAQLFQRTHGIGVRHFILPQDTHSEDAVEFESYPAHCVRGTDEPVTVPELSSLPFSDLFHVIEKDSISSSIATELDAWLDTHPQVTTFLVVGDCTDLCVHQLAMHLRLRANALNLRGVRVILPVDGVDTFDLPVDVAQEIGALPHHGDLLHLIFLYNMAQNGVEIVAKVV
ncbi:MAG: isochorismatase family protein, partial [Anaerolineae bacterium]